VPELRDAPSKARDSHRLIIETLPAPTGRTQKSIAMKLPNTNRLHELRMRVTASRYEMDEMRERFDRLANRAENGAAPRAVSAYQLFQTPPELAARMVALAGIREGARVLEPSAGLGRILDALQPADVTAVEMAPQCAGELFRQERAGVNILQRDFLTVLPDEIGHFDAVVMNPPFHMRSDIRHIEHALDFLKPGGVLVALCMATDHRERALRHQADHWELIPAGAFKAEGTQVPTFLLRIRA